MKHPFSFQVQQGCADERNERDVGISFIVEGELREGGQRNTEQGEGCQGYQDETTMTTSHPGDRRGTRS